MCQCPNKTVLFKFVSKSPPRKNIFNEHELIVHLSQGLTLSTANLVLSMFLILPVSWLQQDRGAGGDHLLSPADDGGHGGGRGLGVATHRRGEAEAAEADNSRGLTRGLDITRPLGA